MSQTRRSLLRRIGAVGLAGTGLLLSSSPAAAKPYVDWEPAHSSNFTGGNRGAAEIDWVVIHTVQGSASGAVSWFQNPNSNVSAHYTIAQDGHRYQSVSDLNVAWHAGGQNYNDWSIGVEHGGYVSGNYEEVQYQESAEIVSFVCDQYNVPKQHPTGVAPCDAANPANGGIIGHHQVPEYDCWYNDHTDPGGNWDWGHYIDLVNDY